MEISNVMLAYRLRATQTEMLNLSLSLTLVLQVFPSPNTYPSLCFPNRFILFSLFSPFLMAYLPSLPFFPSFSVLLFLSSLSNLSLFLLLPKVSFHTATFSSPFHLSLMRSHHLLIPFFHSAQIVAWSGLLMSPSATLSS